MNNSVKPWITGATIGFIVALLIFLAAILGLVEKAGLDGVVQFLGSVPVFLVTRVWSGAPEAVFTAVFLMYWAIVGAVMAWIGSKGIIGKIFLVVFILVLLFAHYKAHGVIVKEIEDAIDAIKALFTGSAS
jgi:hypothetical protein